MATATFSPMTKPENHGNKPAGKEAFEKAKEAGVEAVEKAKEAGVQAIDKAKEAVSSVGEMAGQTATALGQKADDLTATAGHDIKSWADNLGKKAPQEGLVGQASHAVTDTLKEGGRYLEDAKLSGMAEDVTQLIKAHPVAAVLIGLGVGYCIGRTFKS